MGILGFNILVKLTVAIRFVSELILSTQLFKNNESQLLYFYEVLIVVLICIFIFSSVIVVMITPVILFYLLITTFLDFNGNLKNLEKKIYFKKENLDVLLKIPKWRCEKFIESYSLFLGNVFGLIIWNVLSLVYIVFWFKDLKIGLQEYFYFPFEVINSLLKNNIKYINFEFSKQWIFMMSLILISVIFYYIGKVIGSKLAKNRLIQKGIIVKYQQKVD